MPGPGTSGRLVTVLDTMTTTTCPTDHRTPRTTIALLLAPVVALALTACGSDPTTAADAPSGTADTPSMQDGEIQTYEVDGATVHVRSTMDELPRQATTVAFTGTLIDDGNGLELCLGGVAESLPPQCSGPVVQGLDPTGWTETTGGVTWGNRTVVVAWPPSGADAENPGTLTLIDDHEPLPLEPVNDTDFSTPPAECADMTRSAEADAMSEYANANPDRTGTVWVVDNGRVAVLPVLEEHMDEVRAELTDRLGDDAEPCLVPIAHTSAELRAAQDQLHEALGFGPPAWVAGSGSGNKDNVLMVDLAVADRATVEAITALYDDPSLLHIYSTGVLLDGR